MGKANTGAMPSEYYPPRARWYSRIFYPLFAFRRALHLERIRLPVGFTLGQFVLSLLIPGFALLVNGRKKVAAAFAGIYLVSMVCFVVWLGFQVSAWSYGLIISVHASSIIFLETCAFRNKYEFPIRFAVAIATLLVVWLAIYRPITRFIETHWVVPVLVQNRVMVVQRVHSGANLHRGDVLFYRMTSEQNGDAHRGGAVVVREGFGLGQVLAMEGDRVGFSTNSFTVNDVSRPLLSHMPITGEMVLAEKQWFIWPTLDINTRGNVGEAAISSTMLQLAVVSEDQFIGKPFRHWFWRRQSL